MPFPPDPGLTYELDSVHTIGQLELSMRFCKIHADCFVLQWPAPGLEGIDSWVHTTSGESDLILPPIFFGFLARRGGAAL